MSGLDETPCTMEPIPPAGAFVKVTESMYRVYHCPEGYGFDNGDPWFLIKCESGMWKSSSYKPYCLASPVVTMNHETAMVTTNAMATVDSWSGMTTHNPGTTTASPTNAMWPRDTSPAMPNTLTTNTTAATIAPRENATVGLMSNHPLQYRDHFDEHWLSPQRYMCSSRCDRRVQGHQELSKCRSSICEVEVFNLPLKVDVFVGPVRSFGLRF
ncbi:uncharacterized protein LOC119586610 [Penaeus monodon]|uniref:uncharacterized protein LOC119586610 n=1 Tax=Penaeus monodon TaxID=6687 RepID=UPI0018A6DFE9|nr:uncharacterized protein LOC119586610 [Penaeus monodon]